MADNSLPPVPTRRAPLIDIMRELEARPRSRRSQEFDPVAALAAERRSQSRQPLPLPPIPPAAPLPSQTGETQAGAGTPQPAPDLSGVYPDIRRRLPENNPYVAAAIRIAEKYDLPPSVFLSLVQRESNFNPRAVSPRGAVGLGQLMPGTAQELGVDPRDPEANLDASARYLKQQITRFGSIPIALAAYNAGPGRVAKSGNQVPNIRETQEYVSDIMRNAGMEGYEGDQRYGFADGGRVQRESLADMEDRYADAPTVRSADEEYDRRLLERDPLMTPVSRLGVAGVPVPRGGRAMYPGNAVSPFEAAASLFPTPEGVQRGMMSAMAGVDIPEGARVVQTDMTRSGYAIETADGRLIDPEGRQGRDVREFGGTTRRSAVLPVSQDVETGERSLDVPAVLDMFPMAGVQGGPAGTLGVGRTRRPRRGDMPEPTTDVARREVSDFSNQMLETPPPMVGRRGGVSSETVKRFLEDRNIPYTIQNSGSFSDNFGPSASQYFRIATPDEIKTIRLSDHFYPSSSAVDLRYGAPLAQAENELAGLLNLPISQEAKNFKNTIEAQRAEAELIEAQKRIANAPKPETLARQEAERAAYWERMRQAEIRNEEIKRLKEEKRAQRKNKANKAVLSGDEK